MATLICPKYCPSPFCEVSCPSGAITIAEEEKNVYVDPDKCNRCGICRMMCMTWSQDRRLEQRRPWISSDWITVE
ncbi:MAG: 4Fe-4S binding protein [Dehalococcoidales bacterium]